MSGPWYLQEDMVKSYEAWYEGKGRRADILEKQLLKELVDYVGAVRTMLEVGAGTAHFTRWFESLGIRCIGLDCSPLMLKEAKKLWNGELVRGDAQHLPFREKTFDLVALITCIEFIHSPRDALREAVRVTRNGILCGILNKWSLPILRERIQVMIGRNPFYSNARFYSIRDATNLIENALGRINYRIKWATTIIPRILLIKRSRFPLGAFLGLAVKTNQVTHPNRFG